MQNITIFCSVFKILWIGGVDDGDGFSAWFRSVFLQYTVGTTGTEGRTGNSSAIVLELASCSRRPSGQLRFRYLSESVWP